MATHEIDQDMVAEIKWLREQGRVEMAGALEKQLSEHGELPHITVWSHRSRCGYEVDDAFYHTLKMHRFFDEPDQKEYSEEGCPIFHLIEWLNFRCMLSMGVMG